VPRLKRDGVSLALAAEDLVLLVEGPWAPGANLATDKLLWHPRCATERLRQLWAQHETAIRAAAGRQTPWVARRLWFVRELHGSNDPPD
jgi:hypothetical protein